MATSCDSCTLCGRPSTSQLELELKRLREELERRNQRPKPDWRKIADIRHLFNITETEESWQSTRNAVLLSTPEQIIEAFHHLTSYSQLPTSDTRARKLVTTEHDLLRRSQGFNLKLRRSSRQLQQLSSFSTLLHVCLCLIACKARSLPAQDADSFMNDLLSTSRGKTINASSHLSHIRTSVQWPIRQAQRLEGRGFGNRAHELLLIGE